MRPSRHHGQQQPTKLLPLVCVCNRINQHDDQPTNQPTNQPATRREGCCLGLPQPAGAVRRAAGAAYGTAAMEFGQNWRSAPPLTVCVSRECRRGREWVARWWRSVGLVVVFVATDNSIDSTKTYTQHPTDTADQATDATDQPIDTTDQPTHPRTWRALSPSMLDVSASSSYVR